MPDPVPMLVRVQVNDATIDFEVVDLAEGQRVIRALAGFSWWNRWAAFDYDEGRKRACILRRSILWAGMLTFDEAKVES